MAPISLNMRRRYDDAIQHLSDILNKSITIEEVNPDLLSEFKGMVNRCIREDQWDWFSVHAEFGHPPKSQLKRIIPCVISLRKSSLSNSLSDFNQQLLLLINQGVLQIIHVYQEDLKNQIYSEGAGWIYVLSQRENPKILKIGKTDRSVSQRVREINSATGVLIPWAARRVYRVKNAKAAEASIHQLLSEYRVRSDREFFNLDFFVADEVITNFIISENMSDRAHGKVIYYNKDKGYGFIECDNYKDVFFHCSEVLKEDKRFMDQGKNVSFLLGKRPQGPCAVDIKII